MTDQNQDEHKLISQRRQKLSEIRQNGQAFPNDFRRDSLAIELQTAFGDKTKDCLLYTSPSPRDGLLSRMPSSA